MPDFKSEIAAKAEAALQDDETKDDDAGTATGEAAEVVPPTKSDDDSAAADEGDTSNEPEEDEEDTEEAISEDEEESDEEDSEDEEDAEDAAPKGARAQQRIKQLLREKKITQDENAILKTQIAAKDGTSAEKVAADKALLAKGYTPEQIAEGKKFLESMGYMAPEKVSAMQQKLDKIETDRLMEEDRAELHEALKKSKSDLTEKDVIKYVRKWGTSSNPKIAARASLDYGSIIKLIAGKKVVEKVVDETLRAKKKVAPKIPAGGGGSITQKEEPDNRWNPGDRRGSMERLLEKATAHLDE